MRVSLPFKTRIAIIAAVTAVTVAFHYGFILRPSGSTVGLFHAVHGRLCYIPIILSAIWFGVRGGVVEALLIIVLTIPYSLFGRLHQSGDFTSEATEMVFYIAIGLLSGILIEMQRREQKKGDILAKELARREHLSSLGQMAAGLAHEIKNPLGSIKGAAEILSDDFPPGSRKHELLRVLSKETARLNRVVEDFLNFARPRPLQLATTNINRILDDVISQVKLESRDKNIEIVKHLDPGIPQAPFDKEKLHQVFLNVVLNAVAAMKNSGTLTISSQWRKIPARKEMITISIKDTGVGIAPENLDKIFDPFFSTKEAGTGLGLAISHMIVQNHNGHIEAESKPGRGTELRIMLPLERVTEIGQE